MTGPRLPLVVTLAVVLGASAAALAWLPAPFVWISLAWVIACLLAMRTASRTGLRALWFNLAVVVAAVGGLEVWARTRGGGEGRSAARMTQPTFTPSEYYQSDDILGYAPKPGTTSRSQRWYGDSLLYDVTYTIGPDGLRVPPPSTGGPPEACVLFFGDSFTFGDGLEDTQTVPYQVGEIGGGRFEVYNFGYRGYGPHQMLSALEHGRVRSIIKCRPTHVIYSAIKDHVLRAAGRKEHSYHDPRYRLQADGSVRYDGHFDDEKVLAALRPEVRRQVAKSALYRWIMARDRGLKEAEWRLFGSVVAQSRRIVESSYPGSVFEVLVWDEQSGRAKDVAAALRRAGLTPRIAEEILASYQVDKASFYIPRDGHPSAKANGVLARYIVESIVEGPQQP